MVWLPLYFKWVAIKISTTGLNQIVPQLMHEHACSFKSVIKKIVF